jgi:hypothetical protein
MSKQKTVNRWSNGKLAIGFPPIYNLIYVETGMEQVFSKDYFPEDVTLFRKLQKYRAKKYRHDIYPTWDKKIYNPSKLAILKHISFGLLHRKFKYPIDDDIYILIYQSSIVMKTEGGYWIKDADGNVIILNTVVVEMEAIEGSCGIFIDDTDHSGHFNEAVCFLSPLRSFELNPIEEMDEDTFESLWDGLLKTQKDKADKIKIKEELRRNPSLSLEQ